MSEKLHTHQIIRGIEEMLTGPYSPRGLCSELQLIREVLESCIQVTVDKYPEMYGIKPPSPETLAFIESCMGPDPDPPVFVDDPSNPGHLRRCYNPHGLVAFYTDSP